MMACPFIKELFWLHNYLLMVSQRCNNKELILYFYCTISYIPSIQKEGNSSVVAVWGLDPGMQINTRMKQKYMWQQNLRPSDTIIFVHNVCWLMKTWSHISCIFHLIVRITLCIGPNEASKIFLNSIVQKA